MGRFWSLLFLLVPVVGVGIFLSAATDLWPFSGGAWAFPKGHWFPENINEHGRVIDSIFMFILYLTGAIFIATGLALFWFLWKYDAEKSTEPVRFTHGSHTLEVVWSILPAATLLFIAIYQMNAWADAKMRRPTEVVDGAVVPAPPLARVSGRQFQWHIRYAGADRKLDTEDDVIGENLLHVPLNEEVVLQIESEDVLHSFFLPHLRIKQDVVPGMQQFVWFQPNKVGAYDIVCAELCGWGHYKMRGRLFVDSREDFDRWLAQAKQEQDVAVYAAPKAED